MASSLVTGQGAIGWVPEWVFLPNGVTELASKKQGIFGNG